MITLDSIYRIAEKLAEKAGFTLAVARIPAPGDNHERIVTKATYAPWLSDPEFTRTYLTCRDNTLIDKYRCYELWQLVGEAAKLPAGALLEVGVWRGGSGALICKKAKLLGLKEPVYLCDTFTGVVKAGDKDSSYVGGEHADTSRGEVERLLARLGLDNARILEGVFPEQTGQAAEGRIRFCHSDVDVYQSTRDIIDWVWPRLVPGGIMVFDDYGFSRTDGITRVVEEAGRRRDCAAIYNLNGHAVMIKTSPDA